MKPRARIWNVFYILTNVFAPFFTLSVEKLIIFEELKKKVFIKFCKYKLYKRLTVVLRVKGRECWMVRDLCLHCRITKQNLHLRV